jgi:hypothetical protein
MVDIRINDIEMDFCGSEIGYLSTKGLGPCVGFLALFEDSKRIYMEHHHSGSLPTEIDFTTVNTWLEDTVQRVSKRFSKLKIK